MKLSSALIALLSSGSALAFAPTTTTPSKVASTQLNAEQSNFNSNLFGKAAATAAMTAVLWGAPAIMAEQAFQHNLPPVEMAMASAKEMASGTGSRVNKDPESLLRLGLPINNKEVRGFQDSLETIRYDIASKRKAAALDGVKKSKTYLSGKKADKMVASCREAKVCTDVLAEIDATLVPLQEALKESQDFLNGSDQERVATDKAYVAQVKVAKLLTTLEEQMVPDNYATPVPQEYSDLVQLRKRATVEMIVKKGEDGATFERNGVNIPQAKMVMIIDGYAAPVTGGNFVDLVNKGFYTNMKIQRSDGFVVQTGEPEDGGKAVGYVGKAGKAIGAGPNGERLIPTEILVRGDKTPFYESTIEDEGRGGEATVLPFSSYGAMGWAREEYDVNSGSSQFFWLLFDSDLTPAGKNVLDGRYPCFGYVVEGSDFLADIKEGDVIVSAKVTDGLEYLVQPKE